MGKDLKGKELGENFSQRKNGSYCARYFDEFGKRKALYDTDLRLLKVKYSEAFYKTTHKLNIVDEKITLDEWYDKWIFAYKSDKIRKNTLRHYNHIYRTHISPMLGSIRLSEVTKLQIQTLMKNLKGNDLGWETQNKVRVILIDMFNRALEDYFVNRNPAKGVRTASNKPSEEISVLNKDEQALFFECAAGTFYSNLFVVAVNTGLRPGELFALTEDNIDFEKKIINVTHTLVYQKYDDDDRKTFHLELPKTKSSIRSVPINNICEMALKKQIVQKSIINRKGIKKSEFSDRLFVTKYNTPLNSVLYSAAIEKIVNELNLLLDDLERIETFGGHMFRHVFATRCIEAGVKPKTLQKYLGHATLDMTMNLYVHVSNEAKQEEMTLLESELSKIVVNNENTLKKFNQLKDEENKIIPLLA